jgi:hypothetical protein
VFEPRDAGDGSHYVVESASGHLAHVDRDGAQYAAVNMTADEAAQTADQLNREGLS